MGVFIILLLVLFGVSAFAAGASNADTGDLDNAMQDNTAIPENAIADFANAIAHAEGYGPVGALPTRANNPGDIERGDQGFGTISGKTIYGSADAGFTALRNQCYLMLSNHSRIYNSGMTFLQIAILYTGNDSPSSWAANCAAYLGLEASNTLDDLLANY